MKKIVCIVFLSLVSSVWADSSEDGINAFIKHDYKKAVELFKASSARGDSKAMLYLGTTCQSYLALERGYKL